MGFVLHNREDKVLQDGDLEEQMLDWSVLEVAIALKANKVINWLMKEEATLFTNRADVANPDLELD